MCLYSAYAENTRDASMGENLVISQAPHGASNWLTEPGKPSCAICVPDTAMLAVQVPGGAVRGATFIQRRQANEDGHYDFLAFVDRKKEVVPLDELPIGTGVQVLRLVGGGYSMPAVPAAIVSTVHASAEIPEAEDDPELVPVAARGGGGNRRQNFMRRMFS